MCKLSLLDKISFILVIIGALNWGLIAFLDMNVIKLISFGLPIVQRIIYATVALGAIDLLYLVFRCNFFSTNN